MTRKGVVLFDIGEHSHADTTMEILRRMKSAPHDGCSTSPAAGLNAAWLLVAYSTQPDLVRQFVVKEKGVELEEVTIGI